MSLRWMLQHYKSIQFVRPCWSALLGCRWRWWRAVWSVQNQGESSPSPEESPTCCWMRTRRRGLQRQPSPELSLRWNCGCFEKREAGLIWCHCQKIGPKVCLWVIITVMWVILQQRNKVWKILSLFIFVTLLSPFFLFSIKLSLW